MDTTALYYGLFKLVLAIFGVGLGRMALMWFDACMVHGTKFGNWLESANDQAKAIYYAGRFIGVMLVIGFALS